MKILNYKKPTEISQLLLFFYN